jgi:uncharacterized protein (TIGR02246 family)
MDLTDEMQALCDAYVAAYRRGDAAGCAAVFAEDGAIYSAFAPPARGRASIAELHRRWTEGGEDKTLTVVQAGGAGDVAWFVAGFAEGKASGEGHSLCVCNRDADAQWQIRVCSLTAAG